jgi:hypothetical protein
VPIAVQDRAEVTFGGDEFDVTGAGVLDLGILDDVLSPFRRHFAKGGEPLGVEVLVTGRGDDDGVERLRARLLAGGAMVSMITNCSNICSALPFRAAIPSRSPSSFSPNSAACRSC